MINKKRKGFTIVELVIVIAVIAILAGVLIPTFANVIENANKNAALQEVKQAYIVTLTEDIENGTYHVYEFKQNIIVQHTNGTYICITPDGSASVDETDTPTTTHTLVEGKLINNASGSREVTVYESGDLKSALEAGLSVKLGDHITLDEFVTVPADTTATIDLNGHELLIRGPQEGEDISVFYVDDHCELTIIDSSEPDNDVNKAGNIILESSDGISVYFGVIYVSEYGTLNLEGVNVTCNDFYNIDSFGTVNLNNANFIVNCGYGISTYDGELTIEGGKMTASGEIESLVTNGANMSVTGTIFNEMDGTVYSYAPINVDSGEVSLNNITVQTGVDNDVSVRASSDDARVTITDGTFKSGTSNSKFQSDGALITLKVDDEGKFNGEILTVDYIMTNLCHGYVAEDERTWYSIAHTIKSDNKQSFTLLGTKFYNDDGGEVPKGYDVTLYLNIQGFHIVEDIVVNGLLTIAYGDVRVGDATNSNKQGKIIVKPEGKLYLTSDVEVNDTDMSVENLIKDYVTIEEGGTVYLNETEYPPTSTE